MLIGVLSDSHDNLPMIKKAVEVLKRRGVDLVLHAGDYVAPFSLKPLLDSFGQFIGVFGNNDGEKVVLGQISRGAIKDGPRAEIIGDKRILLGHDIPYAESIMKSGDFHLLISGHTHRPKAEKFGAGVILNPGELGGWLYGKSTMAIVDLDTLSPEIIELN